MADSPFQPMDPITQGLTPEQIMMLIQAQQMAPAENVEPGLPDAGLGPVTDATRAGQPNPTASPFQPTPGQDASLALRQGLGEEMGGKVAPFAEAALDYGPLPAKGVVGQFDKAGEAVKDTMIDPSISNLANAGIQGGAAIGSPLLMGGSALLGFGNAAGRDLGLFGTTPAEAQSRGRQQPTSAAQPDLPGLPPEHQGAYKAAMEKLSKGQFRTGAERRAIEGEVAMYRDLATKAASSGITLDEERKRAEQGEYDRRVQGAEVARDREFGRDRRFSETEVGKFFDKMGGLAPFAAATGAGALHRIGAGPAKGFMGEVAAPLATGTAAAFTAASAPSAYNYLYTEPDNPRKRGLEEYGRELPPGHPRKQESLDAAARMQKDNPVKEAAAKEWEPAAIARRLGVSAAEGVGAPLAASVTGAGTRIMREKATAKASNHRGVAPSAQTEAQRRSAAEAAQARRAELREDISARSGDPATAQWFEQNASLGPVQRLRAFNEANGTSYNQRQLGDLQRRVEGAAKDKSTLEAIERLSQAAKAAAAQGDPAWTAIAQGGDASVRATAKLKPQLVQQYPELADMTARRINQVIRDAVRGK